MAAHKQLIQSLHLFLMIVQIKLYPCLRVPYRVSSNPKQLRHLPIMLKHLVYQGKCHNLGILQREREFSKYCLSAVRYHKLFQDLLHYHGKITKAYLNQVNMEDTSKVLAMNYLIAN